MLSQLSLQDLTCETVGTLSPTTTTTPETSFGGVMVDPTRPTAGGVTWLAAPTLPTTTTTDGNGDMAGGFVVYIYQNSTLQAVEIASADEGDGALDATAKIVGSCPLEAPALTLSTARDGRWVVTALANGNLACYSVTTTMSTTTDGGSSSSSRRSSVQFSLRWSVPLTGRVLDLNSDPRMVQLQINPAAQNDDDTTNFALAVVDAEGGLFLYETNAALPSSPPAPLLSTVTCCAWSPDGTRLAVGTSQSSSVEIYRWTADATTNNTTQKLQWMAAIPMMSRPGSSGSSDVNGWSCSHLDWFQTHTLAVGYFRTFMDDDDEPTYEAALHIVDWIKDHTTSPPGGVRSVSNLGDVIPFFEVPGKHIYWTAAAQTALDSSQPLLFVASNVGSDIVLVARTGDVDEDGANVWSVVELADAITTPTDDDDEFLYPTGIAVCTGRLLVSSTDGALTVLSPSVDLVTVPMVAPPPLSTSLPVPPAAAAAASDSVNISTTGSMFSSRALPDVSDEEPPDIVDEDDADELSMIDDDNQSSQLSSPTSASVGSSSTTSDGHSTTIGSPAEEDAEASTPNDQINSLQLSSEAAATACFGTLSPATFIHGQTQPTINQTTSLFGSPATATSSDLRQTTSLSLPVSADSATGPWTSPFGASATTTSIFGQTSSLSSNAAPPLFSAQPTFTQTSSLFGASEPTLPKSVATPLATSTVFGSGSSGPVFGSSSGTPSLGGFAALAEKALHNNESPFDAFAKTNMSSPHSIFSIAKPLFGSPTRVEHEGRHQKETAVDDPTTVDMKRQVGPGAKASDVFDSLDTKKVGSLPIERMEELLDALGEGFHGEELEHQVALIDPTGTGQLERSAFVEWHIRLAEGSDAKKRQDKDGNDCSSLDSDEKAERAVERENARKVFLSLATADGDDHWIAVADFSKLIESFNTTYCEEEHVKTVKKLQKEDNRIYMQDFLDWYIGWLFGGDESSDDEKSCDDEEVPSSKEPTMQGGWGNIFALKEGSWKCDSCMVQNDAEMDQCAACEKPRPGHTPANQTITATVRSSSIGVGGFSFGGATTVIKASGFSFSSGGTASLGASSGPNFAAVEEAAKPAASVGVMSGGFHFQPAMSIEASNGNDAKSPAREGFTFTSSIPAKGYSTGSIDVSGLDAKKAARVFDTLDEIHLGYMPSSKMEDLLDELGEGIHGDELDKQLALVDPDDSGTIQRSSFISWYCNFIAENDGVGSSLDSAEKADRNEEREKARKSFLAFAAMDQEGLYSILVEDFQQLIESMETTYCEEEHTRTLKRLEKPVGKIFLDAFLDWYVEWLFGGDEDFIEEAIANDVGVTSPSNSLLTTADVGGGWGNLFASKVGSWKCDSCMVQNDADITKCSACEKLRFGHTINESRSASTTAVSNIGSGGFFFGEVAVPGTSAPEEPTVLSSGFSFGSGPGHLSSTIEEQALKPGGGFIFANASTSLSFPTKTDEQGKKVPLALSPSLDSQTDGGYQELSSKAPTSSAPKPRMTEDISSNASSVSPPVLASNSLNAQLKTSPASLAGFPPMSSKAPTPIGTEGKAKAETTTTPGYYLTSSNPTLIDSSQPRASTAHATSMYPPMSRKAPTPIVSEAKTSSVRPSSAYPPMSSKAPTPFLSPQPKASTTNSASAYPPISSKAPSPFGSEAKNDHVSISSGHTPMSNQASTSFELFEPKRSFLNTTFASSTPFGSEMKAVAGLSTGFPPASSTAFGSGTKMAVDKASNSFILDPPSASLGPFDRANVPPSRQLKSDTLTPSVTKYAAPTGTADQFSKDRTRKERLTACSLQFAKLVDTMNESLVLLGNQRNTDDDIILRSAIESHVEKTSRTKGDIGRLFGTLSEYKSQSAIVLSRNTEASRHVGDSERLIGRLLSPSLNKLNEFMTQSLDGQSERRRRELAARAMLAKRYLGIAEARYTVLASLSDSEGVGALLRSILTTYISVKGFSEESVRIEQKATDLAASKSRSPKKTMRSPLLLKSPRANLDRGGFSSLVSSRQREKDHSDKTVRWHIVENSLQNLEVPTVKAFNLEVATLMNVNETKDKIQSRGLGLEVATPTCVIKRSKPLFSPSLSTKCRTGWDSASTDNHTRMQQVSFSLPLNLQETTFNKSARDALSNYGTTPEIVREALNVNNRGTPSTLNVNNRGTSSRSEIASIPTPAPRPAFTSSASSTKKAASTKLPAASFSSMSAETPTPLPEALGKASAEVKDASHAMSQASSNFSSISPGPTAGTTSTPENRKTRSPLVGSATQSSKTPSFGNMASLGSSLFSPSNPLSAAEPRSSASDGGLPDYRMILTEFYQKYNPTKMADVGRYLDKYKGQEKEMFAKLAQKYRVPNPLKKAESPTRGFSTPVLNTAAGFGTSEASQLPPSALGASQTTSSFTSQKAQLNASPFMSTSVQDRSGQPLFGDTSTKSALAPTFATSTMSSPSPFGFGQQSSGNTTSQLSPFEQTSSVDPSPFDRGGGSSQVIPMPSAVGVTFGGKSPRDLLTAFYQQINPSKIAEVDKLLSKYQGQEDQLFRNLAKKYNLDPSVFGLSATPSVAGFGASTTGIASSPLSFGQPSQLGGGPTFGMSSPPMTTFGGASGGGFGGASSAAGFGQGFGSGAAGASPFGSSSFGALAQAPAQSSFGSFGSTPPAARASPFGSPFGAARR